MKTCYATTQYPLAGQNCSKFYDLLSWRILMYLAIRLMYFSVRAMKNDMGYIILLCNS